MAATGSVASRLPPALRPRGRIPWAATLSGPWTAGIAMVALVLWSVVLKLPARRRFGALFALAITLLLYTHGWGLFLAAGATAAGLLVIAWSDDRRSILKTGVAVAAAVALCFAPWVPTVLFQARHTAAPWSF